MGCSDSFQRRAQNRAAQKAHRQRQASYTRKLELELQELRTRYNKLCSHVRQIKQAIGEMCMEE
jgi:flagellar capping protein FliD